MPDLTQSGTFAALRRRIPTGLAGGVFWLLLWFILLRFVHLSSLHGRIFLGWMRILVGAVLIALTVMLLVRLVRNHLLWRLRNKLYITYILIGFAPFVLFLTLVALCAYVAAGQFSIHLADNRLHQQLDQIGSDNSARATSLAGIFYNRGTAQPFRPQPGRGGPPPRGPRGSFARPLPRTAPAAARQNPSSAPAARQPAPPAQTPAQSTAQAAAAALGETPPNPLLARLHRHTYVDGAPLATFLGLPPSPQQPSSSSGPAAPPGLPPWAADLHGNQFRGLVLEGQELYLVAIDQRHIENSHLLTVVSSLSVNKALMDVVADGLGRVHIVSIGTGRPRTTAQRTALATRRAQRTQSDIARVNIYGGEEPSAAHLYDFAVLFGSILEVHDWDSGDADNVPVDVRSRPSLLYRQLFGSSLSGFVTNPLRTGFIIICVLFALIEAVAFWAALRLSRQITTSVEELYAGTQRVDRGDLAHRIPALSAHVDQLGELSLSFNRMTGSLERLLVEEQEKERMQNELSIAQEVQANLFPHRVHNLPTLELHGICRPARTVSGDYYDFFVFHGAADPDTASPHETGVGIALGDISGKGISAALLMATLHSAVRAYRLVGEDLAAAGGEAFFSRVASEEAPYATPYSLLPEHGPDISGDGAIFASPARILTLVNRHLYTSTQPEKYATLFLTHYDAASARLTYSNAGHLPPIILGRDGSIRRLDQGGTVAGLFPRVRYDEACLTLHSGDILIGYSDGITEPENDFGEFGEARLIETVARYRDQPLQVISAQVMLALDAWIGAAEQPDDITLVLARQV